MNIPPGGHGGYPGGGWGEPPPTGPWRAKPSTTRRGPGFNKNKGGSGCAVAVGIFAVLFVIGGAVGLVIFLRGRRSAAIEDQRRVLTPSVATVVPARRDAGVAATPTAVPLPIPKRPTRAPGLKD